MTDGAQRTALVTGGATGIGAGITWRLAAERMKVFVVQRSEEDASMGRKHFAEHPFAELIEVGAHDLATGAGCRDAVAECVRRFGRLDILVNNAGVSGYAAFGPVESGDDELIDRIIDTNLKAPLRLARESFSQLVVNEGVVVNISSIAEFQAQRDVPAYVASKAGLGGLTRALACDLAEYGVRVVGIAPGDVETRASRAEDYVAAAGAVKETPLGFVAEPEDVANLVAWLVSGRARYITGTTIVMDGGRTAY
ncbi:SDR family oxidoreductase [Amycolatopsis endophytica]|uniref:NAD(P)-dependent dehydrogenase (Short-subunit alcohol dehydrogenase family) n=1 Tax=Amycolatopsis endophytica TaxID=860233 RepID=A0A853AZI7_9PSEU|nr:SDR family oxidoreductase [Amycolatopsis endophytica]NYI88069.1 NAD(P)-dependent dehydrogenase (short-subunit alcohol dehydrogenase family) [Amycolatopsis endophytica]